MRIVAKVNSMISYLITMMFRLIIKLFFLLEFFLFLRLILKFLGANQRAFVVKQIYEWSNFFITPFEPIFANIYWPKGYFIETATLAAMTGYALLVYVILKLLHPLSKD